MPKTGKKDYNAFNIATGLQFQSIASSTHETRKETNLELVKIKESEGEERITFVPTL